MPNARIKSYLYLPRHADVRQYDEVFALFRNGVIDSFFETSTPMGMEAFPDWNLFAVYESGAVIKIRAGVLSPALEPDHRGR